MKKQVGIDINFSDIVAMENALTYFIENVIEKYPDVESYLNHMEINVKLICSNETEERHTEFVTTVLKLQMKIRGLVRDGIKKISEMDLSTLH